MRTFSLILVFAASATCCHGFRVKSEPKPSSFVERLLDLWREDDSTLALHSPIKLEQKEKAEVLSPFRAFALVLVASINPLARLQSTKHISNVGFNTHKNKNALMTNDIVEKNPRRRKRVLIIMSDTGGGHRASAMAIVAALQELYPNKLDCKILDIWTEYGKWPFNTIADGYAKLAKNPWMWRAMYTYADFPITQWFSKRLVAMRCWGSMKRCFEKEAPDMIISVHPLCQHLPLRIVNFLHGGSEQRRKRVKFVTVVTDLGSGMSMWFHKKVDMVFVPSDAVERLARRNRVPKRKLRKYGLPIRPGFALRNAKNKRALQQKLGLHPGIRTSLIVGGGDGVGKIQKIAKEMAHELGKDGSVLSQLVVLCGKNQALKARLENADWPENVLMSVQGWASNMDQWLGAVDCVVTKAGPGTIAEACASGLPIMLTSRLPGQEVGNVHFVVKGGFGAYSTSPKKIAKTVSRWLKDPQLLAVMSSKSHEAGRPEATKEIAADIGKCLFELFPK